MSSERSPTTAGTGGDNASRLALTLRVVVVGLLSLSLCGLLLIALTQPNEAARRVRQVDRTTVGLEPLSRAEWNELIAAGNRVGPDSSDITLVVFTDYECPFCAGAEFAISAARRAFSDRLAIIYRHYPLTGVHPEAYREARLAECAAASGRFERIQPLLYESFEGGRISLRLMAERAGLSHQAFAECALDTMRVANVDRDLELARRLGTRRTPTMVLQGKLLTNTPDSATLHRLVDSLMAAVGH